MGHYTLVISGAPAYHGVVRRQEHSEFPLLDGIASLGIAGRLEQIDELPTERQGALLTTIDAFLQTAEKR